MMKKLLLLSIFLMILPSVFGQITKCKAFSFSYIEKNELTGNWNKWSDWQEVDVLIVLETKRIKIYSKDEQTYDIIDYKGKRTDSDGNETYEWVCINEDGLKCGVRLVGLKSTKEEAQIYVVFENYMVAYNIYRLN